MIIATRLLKLLGDGGRVEVPINIFAPRPEDGAWSCQYEIGWPEGQEKRGAWGIDSVQALLLALQMIGADIYTSSYHKSGKLIFEKAGGGYGFPVPTSIRSLREGNDANYDA